MKKKEEHQHLWDEGEDSALLIYRCACGVIICSSPSPDGKHDCNLEIGHGGRCRNTFHPEAGEWEKKFQAPLRQIVVTRVGDDYYAKLAIAVGVWGAGKSPDLAIGNLVSAHGEEFGVTIVHDYKVLL